MIGMYFEIQMSQMHPARILHFLRSSVAGDVPLAAECAKLEAWLLLKNQV